MYSILRVWIILWWWFTHSHVNNAHQRRPNHLRMRQCNNDCGPEHHLKSRYTSSLVSFHSAPIQRDDQLLHAGSVADLIASGLLVMTFSRRPVTDDACAPATVANDGNKKARASLLVDLATTGGLWNTLRNNPPWPLTTKPYERDAVLHH